MNDFHKIGSFIKLKMMEQNKSIQSLAEESGYSTKDIGKILDGRLFFISKTNRRNSWYFRFGH